MDWTHRLRLRNLKTVSYTHLPQVANAQRMGCDLSAYPRLTGVYEHCVAQPAFQQAAPSNQPDYIK